MDNANHRIGQRSGETPRGAHGMSGIEQEFAGTNKLLVGLAWMLAGKAIRKAKSAPAAR